MTREDMRDRVPRIAPETAARAFQSLMKREAVRIEYPGGISRCSVRAIAGQETFIVTRRKHAARADLEAGAMRALRAAGAPVPAVLAYDGEWLIQEDVGQRRLSAALGVADVRAVGDLAAQAIGGLLLCQRAAQKTTLAQRVAPIGLKPEWLAALLSTPARIARQLDLPDPDIGAVITPAQLAPKQLAFIKWDARPGNALLAEGGGVAWIDWEHSGARDALDDLAWLLCDEYMPDDAGLESALLKQYLPLFAQFSGRTPENALAYLSRFGILHTCMRLFLVLKHKGEGAWWDPAACERTDRVGVTSQGARRLCARGARWSARCPGGDLMRRFFAAADKRLRELPVDSSPLFASSKLVARITPAVAGAPL